MDKLVFSRDFPNVACRLHIVRQSLNNNNRPNKKNDVITDLGGEGDFPMFLCVGPFFTAAPPDSPTHLTHHSVKAVHDPRITTSVDTGILLECTPYQSVEHRAPRSRV